MEQVMAMPWAKEGRNIQAHCAVVLKQDRQPIAPLVMLGLVVKRETVSGQRTDYDSRSYV